MDKVKLLCKNFSESSIPLNVIRQDRKAENDKMKNEVNSYQDIKKEIQRKQYKASAQKLEPELQEIEQFSKKFSKSKFPEELSIGICFFENDKQPKTPIKSYLRHNKFQNRIPKEKKVQEMEEIEEQKGYQNVQELSPIQIEKEMAMSSMKSICGKKKRIMNHYSIKHRLNAFKTNTSYKESKLEEEIIHVNTLSRRSSDSLILPSIDNPRNQKLDQDMNIIIFDDGRKNKEEKIEPADETNQSSPLENKENTSKLNSARESKQSSQFILKKQL